MPSRASSELRRRDAQRDGASKLPRLTAEEIATRDGRDGVTWTVIRGTVYDITEWIPKHPGGAAIRLCGGREATTLFESYHPYSATERVEAALAKNARVVGIAEDEEGQKAKDRLGDKFDDKRNFLPVVKERVHKALAARGLTIHSYESLFAVESIASVILYFVSQYYKTFYNSYWAAVAFGLLTARLCFCTHDGSHFSNRSAWLNTVTIRFLDLVGLSSVVWQFEHNVSHHMNPNTLDKDNDCRLGDPFVRLHPGLKHRWWHRFNPVLMLWGILFYGRVKSYFSDFSRGLSGHVGAVQFRMTAYDWATLSVFKLYYLVMNFIVPYYLHGPSSLLRHVVANMFTGICQEQLFQLNHIQSGHVPPDSLHWAARQVIASSNWGTIPVQLTLNGIEMHEPKSPEEARLGGTEGWSPVIMNALSAGLSCQIEHHLFPTMCYFLFPIICPVVRQTCRDFGIPYHNFPTYGHAWISWFRYIKDDLGRGSKDDH